MVLKTLVAIVLVGASSCLLAKETTITDEQLAQGGIVIRAITIEDGVSLCKNPDYDESDRDRNGVFDRICIGLTYDPCDRLSSIAQSYVEWQQEGRVCEDRPLCRDIAISPVRDCRRY